MTVTVITGANKGLGYETARQLIERGHTVYLGARNAERGEAAASELGGQFVQLDVTDDSSVEAAMGVIAKNEGHLDVLVNNAGISTSDVNGPVALKVFDTNAIGLIRVTQAALPLLEQSENPLVVNVSSALGSFWAVTNPDRRQFHFPSIVYGSSKAAVSMLTVQYAKTFPGIKFNAVEPGFTATELTPFSGAGQPVQRRCASHRAHGDHWQGWPNRFVSGRRGRTRLVTEGPIAVLKTSRAPHSDRLSHRQRRRSSSDALLGLLRPHDDVVRVVASRSVERTSAGDDRQLRRPGGRPELGGSFVLSTVWGGASTVHVDSFPAESEISMVAPTFRAPRSKSAPGALSESMWPAITATPGCPGAGAFSCTMRLPSLTVPSHHPTVWMSAGMVSEAVSGAPTAPVGMRGARTPSAGMTRNDPDAAICETSPACGVAEVCATAGRPARSGRRRRGHGCGWPSS